AGWRPSVAIIRCTAWIVNARCRRDDTPTVPASRFPADPPFMRQFEFLFAADDLAVLSAYAAAQDLAEAQRRSQPQGSSAAVSTLPLEDASGPADESCEDADGESAETSAPAERRPHTWIPRLRSVEG